MAEELERKAPDPYHSRGDADAALRQYEAFGLALNLFWTPLVGTLHITPDAGDSGAGIPSGASSGRRSQLHT
ncbi:hypothetical protein ACFQ2M_39020 [Kitasatospora saccharophila]|uniref:hypothetical protein n=1 Tax=Kitasatospora saccharophila TaxID=407973 RepID=UPI00363D946A